MSGEVSGRKMRWWVPAVLVLLVAGILGYFFMTEHVARYFVAMALPLVGLVLIALWYAFLTQLPWKRRLAYFGVLVLLVGGTAVVIAKMTRWEGSLTGGAIPRLVWKWQKELDERLDPLEATGGEATLQGAEAKFAQFLGPNRDGVIPSVRLDPNWSANPPEELWRREIGAGWSGFVVSDGRAVTQEQRGEDEMVVCYDLASGEPLWTHSNKARFEEEMGGDGPRSTPTIHEGKVYVMGATGIFDCLDLSDGTLKWSRNVLEEHSSENIMYGKACSPLILDDLVIVTGGKEPGPTVLAYDRLTGEPVWTAGEDAASYASPVLATLAGGRQVVSLNHNTVTGHDPATGELLWTWKWPARMPKSALAQPVGSNRVFVSASYGMGSALLALEEASGEFEVAIVWKKLQMKTKFSNVCIKDGFAYGLDEGRLACVEVATGKRMWRGTNYGYGQNLLASEHVIVQAERGDIFLVEATAEEFREVARLDALDHKTWNNPALAGEYLLVRNDREAICYKLKLK